MNIFQMMANLRRTGGKSVSGPVRTPVADTPAVVSAPAGRVRIGDWLGGGGGRGRFTGAAGGAGGFRGSGGMRGGGRGGLVMAMHDGGKVPKDGVYVLEKGEEVLPKPSKTSPADKAKKRNSEYRRVYLKRRKKA